MKTFITGGYGLIGSALANKTIGSVTVLTRSSKNKERITKKVTVLKKDILEIKSHDIEGFDYIYHCASTVDNYHVLSDPYLDTKTNITGMISLLEACKNLNKKPKIIFLSTFFVYGNEYDRTKKPVNEESKTDPLALYPISKLSAEQILKLYSRLYNIPYLICRLTNVYGEFEHFDNPKKGAVNFLAMQAVKGEPIKMYKNGNYVRDYIHVDDVVSALEFVKLNTTNDTFLIGYGKSVAFEELVAFLRSETGNKSEVITIDIPDFQKNVGITNFKADTTKINSLGWKPSIDYKKGFKKIIQRYATLL